MHSKKEVKYKRILELVLTYFFYLFLIMGLVILFEPKLFDISIFKDAIFFKNSGAWFILTYTILYILIPYINILINSISKKQFITLLLILLSCFCILPTFFGFKSVIDNGYGITMFVCLYLVGAFIGKYKINKHPASLYFFIFMFSQLITFTNFLDNRFFGTLTYNSIFNVIGAISFFLLFSKIKIKSKLINKISISVFSVFIIHMNTFISKYIWTEIFNCTNYYTSKLFIVNLVFSVVTVFIACILIDFLRIKLFSFIEKLFVGKEKNV